MTHLILSDAIRDFQERFEEVSDDTLTPSEKNDLAMEIIDDLSGKHDIPLLVLMAKIQDFLDI